MNGKNLQELIKNLQVFYKCPSCGSHYLHEDITFLGRVDEHCFMQLTCTECSLPILATVLLSSHLELKLNGHSSSSKSKKKKSISSGIVSDLSSGESVKFSDYEPISAGEIVDLHIFLANKSNELTPLF